MQYVNTHPSTQSIGTIYTLYIICAYLTYKTGIFGQADSGPG